MDMDRSPWGILSGVLSSQPFTKNLRKGLKNSWWDDDEMMMRRWWWDDDDDEEMTRRWWGDYEENAVYYQLTSKTDRRCTVKHSSEDLEKLSSSYMITMVHEHCCKWLHVSIKYEIKMHAHNLLMKGGRADALVTREWEHRPTTDWHISKVHFIGSLGPSCNPPLRRYKLARRAEKYSAEARLQWIVGNDSCSQTSWGRGASKSQHVFWFLLW